MKIAFHGAAKGVTGSCHFVQCRETRLLIDCGMYQGGRELEEENRNHFGFDPAEIDFLLLTHAHLDHCGRIPLLVKRGFKGKIICTSATRELARLVMLDSARIQEEEAEYRSKKALRKDENSEPIEPLYDTLDALNCLDYFVDVTSFIHPQDLAPGIRVTFYDAGHILGSASIFLELEENHSHRRVLFSGDLGYGGRAILPDPAVPPKADIVVMETTYGDRLHKQLEPSIEELYTTINQTRNRGGNVLIPSFALERAQEILYYLREGVEQGVVSEQTQVFLDSPMAISATKIFQHHPECFDTETWAVYQSGRDPFALPGLHFTRETAASIGLKQVKGAVIIAGSGMATGGRIRHHLKHNLWRKEASVIFVGYAAHGTLARQIIDGAGKVRIFREEIEVKAQIFTIGGFSAHGDQKVLLDWHSHTGNPEITFLIHGEEEAMTTFGGLLQNTRVKMPALHEEFEIG
jgi:metallo-beta-lactamase family protein